MTAEQREAAVRHLGNGATLHETASLVHVSQAIFRLDWVEGRRDSEQGEDTDAARWYRDAQAARARKKATLRAQAEAVAGSRESADLLAVLRALESEIEPTALVEETERVDITTWTPRARELGRLLLVEIAGTPETKALVAAEQV